MRKPGTRQFVILVAEGSPLENFYQEEAQQRGSSVTKLLHDLINERFLIMTGIIEQSSYWPGGRRLAAIDQLKTKHIEEKGKDRKIIDTPENSVIDAFGDIDKD